MLWCSDTAVPKAPLCKGGCHANSVTGGLCRWIFDAGKDFLISLPNKTIPPPLRGTSLYTREALVRRIIAGKAEKGKRER